MISFFLVSKNNFHIFCKVRLFSDTLYKLFYVYTYVRAYNQKIWEPLKYVYITCVRTVGTGEGDGENVGRGAGQEEGEGGRRRWAGREAYYYRHVRIQRNST